MGTLELLPESNEADGYPDLNAILGPNLPSPIPPSTAPPTWASILAPSLHHALSHRGTYTPTEVTHHLSFFTTLVAPWLGPAPSLTAGDPHPLFPSSMTNDHTPFELSACWKSPSQNGRPIIRYVVDLIPPHPTRASSLTTTLTSISDLSTYSTSPSSPLTLTVFPALWSTITTTLLSHESTLHPHGTCPTCAPSSTFIGFDLVSTRVQSKLYWLLPSCPTTPSLLHLLDTIFASCAATDPFFSSPPFTSSWRSIRAHIAANPDTLRPRMLSVDATQFPSPRAKFYARALFPGDNSYSTGIARHLSMDNTLPLSADFEETCRGLWDSLVVGDEGGGKRTKYSLILYEIGTRTEGEVVSGVVKSKLYVMLQEIPRRDAVVAEMVLRHCRMAVGAPLLQRFAESKRATAFITELGLAARKEGTEISIYATPCVFSRRLWGDAEDERGYFEKIRAKVTLGLK